MGKGTRRDLGREAHWRQLMGEQARSGLSIRAWCREREIGEANFYSWRRELARRDSEQADRDEGKNGTSDGGEAQGRPSAAPRSAARRSVVAPEATFVPVQVADDTARVDDPQIEIVLLDGRRVCVTGTVDREALAVVLDVLTSASPARCPRGEPASSGSDAQRSPLPESSSPRSRPRGSNPPGSRTCGSTTLGSSRRGPERSAC
jgi:hypothetical protein